MRLSAPIYQLKRRAKSIAREQSVPLHTAQDRVAKNEGFASWSLLAAKATSIVDHDLLSTFEDGDLVLIAARQGHGKTRLALQSLLDARKTGRRAVLFTLEMMQREAQNLLAEMSDPKLARSVSIETSDDIDADYIIEALKPAAPGTIAVVDYLQRLDECREKNPLAEQIEKLRSFAKDRKIVFIFIAQIDRAYDPSQRKAPTMRHVRLPNPVATEVFNRRVFLHDGEVSTEECSA